MIEKPATEVIAGLLFLISLAVVIAACCGCIPLDSEYRAIAARIKADSKAIADAIKLFKIDTDRYPETLDELMNGEGIEGWQGPYLRRPPLDPWGRPYLYDRSGDTSAPYEIWTFGADGKKGGERENKDYSSRDFLTDKE